jgi:hypothetical protein
MGADISSTNQTVFGGSTESHGKALEIAHLVIGQYYRKKAALTAKNSKSGAVTLIQRFGGSLNLNIHFHQLFVDGCYELNEQK